MSWHNPRSAQQMLALIRELPEEQRVARVREILAYPLPSDEHVEAELVERLVLVAALRWTTGENWWEQPEPEPPSPQRTVPTDTGRLM